MRHTVLIIALMGAITTFLSCNRQLEAALDTAGANRTEMEKVLDYFRDDPDPLKYEAAKFLIENMPYHYTQYGKGATSVDSAYLAMSEYPVAQREKVFRELVKKADSSSDSLRTDIKAVSADYLIKVIEEACDQWHEAAWGKEYDISLFFDYVLPYRILNEPLSDWRESASRLFPSLRQNSVSSERGVHMEAETLELEDCSASDKPEASQGKLVLLDHTGASVSFDLNVSSDCKKSMTLRYSAPKRNTKADVTVNGRRVDAVRLDPTNGANSFRTSRSVHELKLSKGANKVSVCFAGDTIGLDYVQIGSIEECDEKEMEDYSHAYCRIRNMQNGHYITFDTLRASLLSPLGVRPRQVNDSTQMVRMDYYGRSCWRISAFKSDTIDLCMEVQYASMEVGAAVSQYKYIGGNNQKWVIMPVGKGLSRIMSKDTGLFLDIRQDEKTGRAMLVLNPYAGGKSQKWRIERAGDNPFSRSRYAAGSMFSEALRVHELMKQFEWVYFSTGFAPKASSLLKARTGNCRDEASYTAFLSRILGIPATIDFTPHWGNRSWGHHWCVLIKPDGKSVPFYMGGTPGDTAQFFHSYVKAKVFRRRFGLNRQMAEDMRDERSVPRLFQTPTWTDVTGEYCPTTDVTRSVPQEHKDKKVAYICIFDNKEWMPVYYGVVRDGEVTFPNMGRNVMYVSAFYENGRIVPFGAPFCIDGKGAVRDIRADTKRKCTLRLTRKYPFFSAGEQFNFRMRDGLFQGSSTPDFSNATDLHRFDEVTNGGWYEIPVKDAGKYRYLRYRSPDGSHGNINELWFFDENGDTIKGEPAGSDGASPENIEKVFDNNILTGYDGASPDGNWVGIKLTKPRMVSRIRFIPRTDGNCIEIGDKYELMMWTGKGWKVLASLKAASDVLSLKNMPANGLYLLKDITKGSEQRIFTYEGGKQIWW